MILYDNERNGLELSDGPDTMPGSVRMNVHSEEHFKADTLLTRREALEVADALTHGKLQAMLDAIDANLHNPMTGPLDAIRKAREALR